MAPADFFSNRMNRGDFCNAVAGTPGEIVDAADLRVVIFICQHRGEPVHFAVDILETENPVATFACPNLAHLACPMMHVLEEVKVDRHIVCVVEVTRG